MVKTVETVKIIVYGTPGPQGSKRYVGGRRMIENSKLVKPWRESVVWAAREAMAGRPPILGAVVVSMVFTLRKPAGAPKRRRTYPATRPDLSKLARSTEDAMTTAGVYGDDGQIIEYSRLAKVYPLEDRDALDVPGVRIVVIKVAEE